MLELFQLEATTQLGTLTQGLLTLESDPAALATLDTLMRAVHSLKGAARMINFELVVRVAHALEDGFVRARKTQRVFSPGQIDTLLGGLDMLNAIAFNTEETMPVWQAAHGTEIDQFLDFLQNLEGEETIGAAPETAAEPAPIAAENAPPGESAGASSAPGPLAAPQIAPPSGRALRVSADNLNHLLGLAGESVVAASWVSKYLADLSRLKYLEEQAGSVQQRLRDTLLEMNLGEGVESYLSELGEASQLLREAILQRNEEMDSFERRFTSIAQRNYQEVLDCQMRPFSDTMGAFPRMVRDVARTLGKQVKLEVVGEATAVDRDIMERLEAPLGHLFRNAVDHGLEIPAIRLQKGKPEVGTLRVEARHNAGMLLLTVGDDGAGIDLAAVKTAVVELKHTTWDVADKLSEAELLQFLFLPGFSMKDNVSEISGRGVGLDVVHTMVQELGGRVRLTSRPGQGTQVQLQLPLTLSVIRSLLVEIAGEPYAFPLARVARALKLPRETIESSEGRDHFAFGEERVGLVSAHQLLELGGEPSDQPDLCVVVLAGRGGHYGLVVDGFGGEQELVVQPLDSLLGKVPDISSGALMADQSPVLIFDVEDLVLSMQKLAAEGHLAQVRVAIAIHGAPKIKRILVVDDSLTVRELERKLLLVRGYHVEVAVDGMDGWNAVRTGRFDLVITDVDMPRMDGIQLVGLMKNDPRLRSLPVMIVSYKDREEDRRRGLEAGADFYLTKSSFHDETLLEAVTDLIGGAAA